MSTDDRSLFWRVLERFRTFHGDRYRPWFSELHIGELRHGHWVVTAPTLPMCDYLRSYCLPGLLDAARDVTERLISFEIKSREEPVDLPGGPLFEDERDRVRLNPDYLFDNFVTGPCNRLAHAACVAVSEMPGRDYNPLFIHGHVGLGKTHLLQAVCHAFRQRKGKGRYLFLSCETFIRHFIDALQRGMLSKFRDRYRRIDLLVVDDVHFLGEHERTQEEFFHTFNTLHQENMQLIFSSDSPPNEIKVEERLTSRFNWGLVANVDKPCLETRMAIVAKKAQMRDLELPDEAVSQIAVCVQTNTRELEGALTRVQSLAALTQRPITVDLVEEALGPYVDAGRVKVNINQILDLVTQRFEVRLADLQSKKRSKSITLPRQVCMYLARNFTDHSFEEIGGYFGGRDHTTVMHATRTIQRQRLENPRLAATLNGIELALHARRNSPQGGS